MENGKVNLIPLIVSEAMKLDTIRQAIALGWLMRDSEDSKSKQGA